MTDIKIIDRDQIKGVLKLPETSFIASTVNQKKIRVYENDDQHLDQLITVWILELENHYSPNNDTSKAMIKDIKKCVLSICKNLSIEELFYASQMARYGQLGEVNSYGSIDTKFVAHVVLRYKEFKRQVRVKNNMSLRKYDDVPSEKLSDAEKNAVMIKSYGRIKKEYKAAPYLNTLRGYAFLYDYIVKDLQEFEPTDEEITDARFRAKQIRITERNRQHKQKGIPSKADYKFWSGDEIALAKIILLRNYFDRPNAE